MQSERRTSCPIYFSYWRFKKNLGFQRGWTEPYCARPSESTMILRSSETNNIPFQTSGFLFKPCPLPHLMCGNRSVLCFCYAFSKCFLGLAPLLCCYTPGTYFTRPGNFPIRQDTWRHTTRQFCPGHLYKTVRLSNINSGSMFLSPCASLFRQGAQTVQITWQFTWNFNC